MNIIARQLIVSALFAAAFVPAAANAQSLSLSPSPSNLNDLDHHNLYNWRMNPVFKAGATTGQIAITGATLTFTQIRNWNSDPNALHLHLMDTSNGASVATFVDDKTNNPNVQDLTDDFTNTRYHNGLDANGNTSPWLVPVGAGDTFLVTKEFTATAVNYTYMFSVSQLLTMNNYYRNGGDFSLGFDSDYHFFNSGISLNMTYQYNAAGINPTSVLVVPEPGTYVTGAAMTLPLIGMILRRRRTTK